MWHTKYDLPISFNEGKTFDQTNCVDRLTYMDSSRAIEQMKRFGRQTTFISSQALYHSFQDLDSDPVGAVPVYRQDPVDAKNSFDSISSVIRSEEPIVAVPPSDSVDNS